MKINITCGQIANDYYSQIYDEIFVPFNEAMINGVPKEDIFSDEFILERVETHRTTLADYLSKMKSFLDIKNQLNKCEIVCWFGNDDFCQINLLTLLAFLDQIHYTKEITINLINENNFAIENVSKVNVDNYKKLYLENILSRK